MNNVVELEDGFSFVTLEKMKGDRWDEKIALIEDEQISFGFMKWNEDKTQVYDFKSFSLVGTDDLLTAAKAILNK